MYNILHSFDSPHLIMEISSMLIVVTAFEGKHISIIIPILTAVYLHFITDLLYIFITHSTKVIVVGLFFKTSINV